MALTPPAQLEALLFAAGEPLQKKRLSAMIGVSPELLQKAADTLRQELAGRGLELVETDTPVLQNLPSLAQISLKFLKKSRP